MRRILLIAVVLGCASGRSKYGDMIDPPFLAAAVTAEPAQSFHLRAGAGVGGASVQGAVSVEVPRVVAAAFFGVSLAGASDLVFVLDRSGSMYGRKLDEAKLELVRALDALPDGTRFNVIFFGDRVTPLASAALTLDATTRAQTKDFVRRVGVGDRTAMVPALWYADQMGSKRVVLLTDGIANVGGGPDEVIATGRAMIRRGVRFDVVMLYQRHAMLGGGYVRCADRFPAPGMSQSTASIEAACEADAAADVVRTLATESGGAYRDPLAPPP